MRQAVARIHGAGARIHIDNSKAPGYVVRQFFAAGRPPLHVARRGALLHHVAPGPGARRVPFQEPWRPCSLGGVPVWPFELACRRRRYARCSRSGPTRACRRSADRATYAIAATVRGHHARECAARLGPVKAFRADCRYAPTPGGADGLDRPFGRAGIWLLRDGPPATDRGGCDCGLEPHEFDAVVAFVRILLEWDDRARRMSRPDAHEGAADDDSDERLEPRRAVCAGVE